MEESGLTGKSVLILHRRNILDSRQRIRLQDEGVVDGYLIDKKCPFSHLSGEVDLRLCQRD